MRGSGSAAFRRPVMPNRAIVHWINTPWTPEHLGLFDHDVLLGCVVGAVGAKRPDLVDVNRRAFERGCEDARTRLDARTSG